MLKAQNIHHDPSFGIIKKKLFSSPESCSEQTEPRILHVPFVIILSLDAFCLQFLLIFLAELFLNNRDQMLEGNENQYAEFKAVQKILDKEIMVMELQLNTSQANQFVASAA